jgi:type VI secretion system secreted protein Hcp
MIRRVLLTAIAASAIAALPGSALAGSFLKLTNIPGESTNDMHRGEIDILTFTQSFVRVGTTFAAGGAGKAQCGAVTLMKNIDKSSPDLLKHVVIGRHIDQGILTFQKNSERPFEYYTITMQDVVVTELTQTDTADPASIFEKLVLNAREYTFEYRPQDDTGNLGTPVRFHWDCAKSSE